MLTATFGAERCRQAAHLVRLGATDRELAEFFQVAASTFALWKVKFPDLSETLKEIKEASDNRVERSLYTRAIGYSFDSEKITVHKAEVIVKDGKAYRAPAEIVRVKVVEHVPPDVTAQIFWLKNRKRAEWTQTGNPDDPQGGNTININIADKSDRELALAVLNQLTAGVVASDTKVIEGAVDAADSGSKTEQRRVLPVKRSRVQRADT